MNFTFLKLALEISHHVFTGCKQVNYSCRSEILDDGVEYTALTYACWNLSLTTVDLLLEHGARVDLGNPLHSCVNQILLDIFPIDMYMRCYVMANASNKPWRSD